MTIQIADDVANDLVEMLSDHEPVENPGGEPLCQVCGDYWHECPVMALRAASLDNSGDDK